MAQTGRDVKSIAATIGGPHTVPTQPAAHAAADGGMRGAASFLAKRVSGGEGGAQPAAAGEGAPEKTSAKDVAAQITNLLKQLVQRFWTEIAAAREQVLRV